MNGGSARFVVMWVSSCEAQLTVDGPCDDELPEQLEDVLERLLAAHATHVVVDLHRVTGDDAAVVELLAATYHRFRARQGALAVLGLRHRLVSRPEVRSFPEIFGMLPRDPPGARAT